MVPLFWLSQVALSKREPSSQLSPNLTGNFSRKQNDVRVSLYKTGLHRGHAGDIVVVVMAEVSLHLADCLYPGRTDSQALYSEDRPFRTEHRSNYCCRTLLPIHSRVLATSPLKDLPTNLNRLRSYRSNRVDGSEKQCCVLFCVSGLHLLKFFSF